MKYKLKILWLHLSQRRKRQYFWLVLLMIISSFAEMISLGAVLPFLGMLTMPNEVFQHAYMAPINGFLNITEAEQLLLPLTFLFIGCAIFAGIVRVTLLYCITRLSYATGADIGVNIYRRTLYQDQIYPQY